VVNALAAFYAPPPHLTAWRRFVFGPKRTLLTYSKVWQTSRSPPRTRSALDCGSPLRLSPRRFSPAKL